MASLHSSNIIPNSRRVEAAIFHIQHSMVEAHCAVSVTQKKELLVCAAAGPGLQIPTPTPLIVSFTLLYTSRVHAFLITSNIALCTMPVAVPFSLFNG